MRFGLFWIKASRWPWQKGYDWRGMVECTAPLNVSKYDKSTKTFRGARFGGGWSHMFGFAKGGNTINFYLLFGIVSVTTWKSHVANEKWWSDFRTKRAADKESQKSEGVPF